MRLANSERCDPHTAKILTVKDMETQRAVTMRRTTNLLLPLAKCTTLLTTHRTVLSQLPLTAHAITILKTIPELTRIPTVHLLARVSQGSPMTHSQESMIIRPESMEPGTGQGIVKGIGRGLIK